MEKMEAAICKTSNGEMKDVALCLNHETEDVLSPNDILENKENTLEVDREIRSNSVVNGHIGGDSEKTVLVVESPKISESLAQKSMSPTLIEHAFNVMKNLFSPDKNRNKSANILGPLNHLNSSGSPCNSIYIPSKIEQAEIANIILSGSAEKSSKDHLVVNQIGVTNCSNNSDLHNTTDDSFLTTVSLIDESFQSAVTHLDENTEAFRDKINFFNNSQNLDVLDSDNETLESSGYCLESTMLRNASGISEENKIENVSEIKDEVLDFTQVIATTEKVEEKKVEEIAVADGEICEVLAVNMKSKEGDDKITESLAVEKIDLDRKIESIENFEMKEKPLKLSENITDPTVSSSEEGTGCNLQDREKVEIAADVQSEEGEPLESKISTTTVVLETVDTSDIENMLMSLKVDSSGTNTPSTTSLEGIEAVRCLSLENLMEKQPNTKSETAITNAEKSEISGSKSLEIINNVPMKSSPSMSSCKSQGNSPNKPAEKSQNKLNNSIDSINKSPRTNEPVVMPGKNDILALKESLKAVVSPEMKTVSDKKESEIEKSDDVVSVVSQQSYTVLSSNDKNLTLPVITSSEELNQELSNDLSPESGQKSNATFSKDVRDSVKHSTPVVESGSGCKLSKTGGSTVKGTSLDFERISETNTEKELEKSLSLPKSDCMSKTMQLLPSNEEPNDFSPINRSGTNVLSNTLEGVMGRLSIETIPEVNNTWVSDPKSPNETFENNPSLVVSKKTSPRKLNQTYDKAPDSLEQLTINKLNETYDKKSEAQGNSVNQTLVKQTEPPCGMNQTYNLKTEGANETFNAGTDNTYVKDEVNKTFDLQKINQTFDKEPEVLVVSKNPEIEVVAEHTSPQNQQTEVTTAFTLPHSTETESPESKDFLNNSFISTTSSKASLSCAGNATMLLGVAPSQAVDDLASKIDAMSLNEATKTDAGNADWGEGFVELPNSEDMESKLKEDGLKADAELAQLIQEQFSSTDIEKICSVVDDIPMMKLSSQILKASEQFEKSFHGRCSKDGFESPSCEFKSPNVEFKVEKTLSDLTPSSLDYLNAIKGKPTGRDLSRESLYVKFDPLVQPNSLIDFTKEGVSLPTIEASPEPETNKENVCEQLLFISPQKEPDDIVPPLTPLSHKGKTEEERLKELKNEIYFLKNLYNERERTNKAKFEECETQIAKLTGQNCLLEEKLKESEEREKSLVKKLKEQNENSNQLKRVMDEYCGWIEKLSSELAELKEVNAKQVEALKTETAEKDSYVTHLQNTEAAFCDLLAKYEKSKKSIMSLKGNESVYKKTIAEQMEKLEEFNRKAEEVQKKALEEFERVQKELDDIKANHKQEAARLNAQLRKSELKLKTLQESLDQKVKENVQLTAICEELIEGKK